MIRSNIFVSLSVSILFLFSCQSESTEQAQESSSQLQFASRIYQKTSSNCENPQQDPCAEIKLEYPSIVFGEDEVKEAINGYLHSFVATELSKIPYAQNTDGDDIEGKAKDILKAYDEQAGMEENTNPWEVAILGDVLFQSSSHITIQMSSIENITLDSTKTERYLITFDAQTGKKLMLTDLVSDRGKVREMSLQKLNTESSPKANLSEENVGLTEKGLTVQLEDEKNPDQSSTVTLSHEELGELLKNQNSL